MFKKIDLESLKNLILECYNNRIKGICIFGSYADGNFTGSSDIDILIIFKDEHKRKDYTKFVSEVENKFNCNYELNPIFLSESRINIFKPIYVSLIKGYIPLFNEDIFSYIVEKTKNLIKKKKIIIKNNYILTGTYNDIRID